jgi:hypothetical protein
MGVLVRGLDVISGSDTALRITYDGQIGPDAAAARLRSERQHQV